MKFSYNWLKELAKFKESPEKLAEFLMLRVFEVESVLKKGRDWALEVKVLPNRVADCAGHEGLAREVAALKNSKSARPRQAEGEAGETQNPKLVESSRRAEDALEVKVENPADCPRYTARVMSGVKVAPSPKWMRERLETCGLQSISNIVDAANYVMLELGQPLHVFGLDKLKINGSQKREFSISDFQFPKTIAVRRARQGEKLLALDDKTYLLPPEVLVIADEVEPIAIAGIKGGKESGVSPKTTNIVLESANFNPVLIRLGSQALRLKTDASYRFEHGMDPNDTARAIDRLAEVIREVAGGEVLAGRVDVYPRPFALAKILFRPERISSIAGEKIPVSFAESSLKVLGWGYQKKGNAAYTVTPPTVRRDIQIEEDVIEEILRLLGYEKIKPRIPRIHPIVPDAGGNGWGRKIKDRLAASGLTEVYVYEFISRGLLEIFGETAMNVIEVENPINPDTQFLLPRPLYQYTAACAENLQRTENVSIFGLAKGFRPAPRPSQERPSLETKYLTIARVKRSRSRESGAETFYSVKGIIDELLNSLGIADHWYDDALAPEEKRKAEIFHPYRRAQVKVGDEYIGIVGELHPAIQEKLKAKGRIVAAEILAEKLMSSAQAESEFKPIGKYPAVIRDIALTLAANTKTEAVLNVIETAGGKLLVDSDLFDYFQDEAMSESDKKSLAFHLVFQSPERTLTDGEVNRIYKKIAEALQRKGWEARE